ncbi:MAG: ABC transporter ATP-binding protein [Verrucomicrobia bacterium]|nr:ABC transporter ATP-binding protein [Verrucomicrobiota bacterium]
MHHTSDFLVFGTIPGTVLEEATAAGLDGEPCLFAVRADLTLDGRAKETWLVVSEQRAIAFVPGEGIASGPFVLRAVEKVRSFQTVGSAFLQFQLDGLYMSAVRYSNALRETFGRVRIQLERLVRGEPLQREALDAPSERLCATCGLPLPGRKAACPRCQARRGIFRRTLALMKPYRTFTVLLVSMMIVGVGLDLIPPLLTRMMVDKVLVRHEAQAVPGTNVGWLPWILLGLVVTSLGRHALNIFIGRTSSLIGTRITKELRQRLQSKLLEASVDYYDRHSPGSLMSRVLYDVDQFQGFVVQVAQGFLLNLMLVLGIGTVLFLMNWRLALLVLLPIPFVIAGTTFFWRHIYPRYYKLWDSQSKMAQLLTGLLSGIRLVKSFAQEDRERARFQTAAGYMRDSRRDVEMSVATFNPVMAFVFGLGGLIIWYVGGHLVLKESLTLGTLVAFIGYSAMFYSPISSLSMFSNWATGFLTAGQRVFEVLDITSGVNEDPDPVRLDTTAGAIEFRNVTFGYDPYTPVLKNVSLKIEPGEFIGIVGKSGSGKTTLVNLICRFYDVQQGEVLIDGVDVRAFAIHDLHRQVGLVLQEPFLFRASIEENIAYGRPGAGPLAVMDAARAANAHGFISQMPAGYNTRLGERGAGLSGGERQRVSIARALLCDPRILILDEATSSVDTESEMEIQRALGVLGRGRTTIAIAHRLSTLKGADCIYVMDDGRIVESGTHEELMECKGVYHKLVRIQTQLTRIETE